MNGAVFTLSAKAGLVCRMEVDKRKAKFTGEYEGTWYDLSSLFSKKELDGNQGKYINFYGPER